MAKDRTTRPGGTDALQSALPAPKALAIMKEAEKPKRKKPAGCSQLTVWVPDELAYRLDQISRFTKTRKSVLTVKLLEQGCSRYDIDKDLRSAFMRICSQLRESGKENVA